MSAYTLVYVVDVRCLACARAIGVIEARAWPMRGPVLLRRTGEASITVVADWSRVICHICGGNAYIDELRTIRVYPRLSVEELGVPRRGRPPKKLLAERAARVDNFDE